MELINQLIALYKYAISFTKKTWEIYDYPLRFRKLNIDPSTSNSRFKYYSWHVQIINWWSMSGRGNTKEEALVDIKNNLNNYKINKGILNRPGVKVPIEFASIEGITQYEDIEEEFMKGVFDMDLYGTFTTDESSIYDFILAETEDEYNSEVVKIKNKIMDNYDIDISDIEDGNLLEILKRIKNKMKL